MHRVVFHVFRIVVFSVLRKAMFSKVLLSKRRAIIELDGACMFVLKSRISWIRIVVAHVPLMYRRSTSTHRYTTLRVYMVHTYDIA